MKNNIRILLLGLIMLGLSGLAWASDPPPMVMLKNMAVQMTTELDRNLGHLSYQYVSNLVTRIVVPHFDTYGMSRAVVGREYWSRASAVTQQQFVRELTRYAINTYTSAIQSYDGEKLRFYPIRNFQAASSRVQINSDLVHRDGPPIQIQYRLENIRGKWLIYDYSIDGVSVVQNYRSQFSEVLRQGGLEKLVQQLHQHNQGKQ